MMLGFWKLKVTAGIENTISPYGMLNQFNQPAQFGHFSHLDPPHQQLVFQLTEKICM
jgi:hypothetical protein